MTRRRSAIGLACRSGSLRPRLTGAIAFTLALACSHACLTGCGPGPRTDPRLILALSADPSTLDPALSKDVASGTVVGYLYQNLVRFDEHLALVPDLADEWHTSTDGLSYAFHIRKDARFASGRAVTAQDVADSLERLLDPRTGSGRTWVLDHVRGAQAMVEGASRHAEGIVASGDTLTLNLDRPFAPLMARLTMPAAAVVDPRIVAQYGDDFAMHGAGSGPFVVASWVRDAQLVLKPNPGLPALASRLPGVVVRVIREPITMVTEFRLGNLDLISVPSSEYASLRTDARYRSLISDAPGLNVYFLGLNCERGPTKDVRVRRAIARAIDRDRIVRTVRAGQAMVAQGPIPPGVSGYDPALAQIPYDPEGARRALADAGIAPGTVLRLVQSDTKSNLEVTQMIAAYLGAVGFDVKLVAHEWSTFKAKVDQGQFDAYYLNWSADYPDGENFLYPLFHSSKVGSGGNGPRYRNVEVDRMLDEALASPDPRRRDQLYRAIAARCVGDASRVFLFHKRDLVVTQPWVRGYVQFPVFNSDRLARIALDSQRIGRF